MPTHDPYESQKIVMQSSGTLMCFRRKIFKTCTLSDKQLKYSVPVYTRENLFHPANIRQSFINKTCDQWSNKCVSQGHGKPAYIHSQALNNIYKHVETHTLHNKRAMSLLFIHSSRWKFQ